MKNLELQELIGRYGKPIFECEPTGVTQEEIDSGKVPDLIYVFDISSNKSSGRVIVFGRFGHILRANHGERFVVFELLKIQRELDEKAGKQPSSIDLGISA